MRWSTDRATSEAWSGRTGELGIIAAAFRRARAPQQNRHEAREQNERDRPGSPHEVAYGGRVAAGLRVVVVTEEQELVDHITDLLLRRLDEREAEILRRVFDAEEVPCDVALW